MIKVKSVIKLPVDIFGEMGEGLQTASRWIEIIEREQKAAFYAGFLKGFELAKSVYEYEKKES